MSSNVIRIGHEQSTVILDLDNISITYLQDHFSLTYEQVLDYCKMELLATIFYHRQQGTASTEISRITGIKYGTVKSWYSRFSDAGQAEILATSKYSSIFHPQFIDERYGITGFNLDDYYGLLPVDSNITKRQLSRVCKALIVQQAIAMGDHMLLNAKAEQLSFNPTSLSRALQDSDLVAYCSNRLDLLEIDTNGRTQFEQRIASILPGTIYAYLSPDYLAGLDEDLRVSLIQLMCPFIIDVTYELHDYYKYTDLADRFYLTVPQLRSWLNIYLDLSGSRYLKLEGLQSQYHRLLSSSGDPYEQLKTETGLSSQSLNRLYRLVFIWVYQKLSQRYDYLREVDYYSKTGMGRKATKNLFAEIEEMDPELIKVISEIYNNTAGHVKPVLEQTPDGHPLIKFTNTNRTQLVDSTEIKLLRQLLAGDDGDISQISIEGRKVDVSDPRTFIIPDQVEYYSSEMRQRLEEFGIIKRKNNGWEYGKGVSIRSHNKKFVGTLRLATYFNLEYVRYFRSQLISYTDDIPETDWRGYRRCWRACIMV